MFDPLILDSFLADSPFPNVPDAGFDPLGDFGDIVDFLQFQIRGQLPFERMLFGCFLIVFFQHFLQLFALHAQQFFGSCPVDGNVFSIGCFVRPVVESSLIIFLALFRLFIVSQSKTDRVASSRLMQPKP